jgi:phosphoserine phosphatase RsbU/P
MTSPNDWRADLKFIVEFMRELSRQDDPQVAAKLYGERIRQGRLFPVDAYLALSRRELTYPNYYVTRSSSWTEDIDPWREKHRLPMLKGGMLADLLYSDEPAIIEDLSVRVPADDPAAQYVRGMNFALAIPQYDDGISQNMGLVMTRDSAGIERDRIPGMIMQANLWGRAVLSSVLRRELKEAYDALDHEFKAVGDIQRSLLPRQLPAIEGLDLAVHYETSQRAGGDYYDFFPLTAQRWGIFIADVAGHGVPAAVRMAITHAVAHTRPDPDVGPCEILRYLNSTLERYYIGKTGTFVTAFYAIYDPNQRKLTYASAGHPAPRLARDGSVVPLDGRAGLPLGIEPDSDYPEHQLLLRRGDRLLLYTDGIYEAFNEARELYGTERLDVAIAKSHGDAQSLLDAVLADVTAHCNGAPAADDRTLLAIRVR